MDTEPPRLVFGASGLAGAAVAGLYTAVMAFFAGQPLGRREALGVLVNLAAAVIVGGAVAYFMGPSAVAYVPATIRDPHALGFAIGAGSWEAMPWLRALVRVLGKRAAGKAGKP
jgi:hypothetical protein